MSVSTDDFKKVRVLMVFQDAEVLYVEVVRMRWIAARLRHGWRIVCIDPEDEAVYSQWAIENFPKKKTPSTTSTPCRATSPGTPTPGTDTGHG
jgi:hypothetical protein